jgi:hypothetical protein
MENSVLVGAIIPLVLVAGGGGWIVFQETQEPGEKERLKELPEIQEISFDCSNRGPSQYGCGYVLVLDREPKKDRAANYNLEVSFQNQEGPIYTNVEDTDRRDNLFARVRDGDIGVPVGTENIKTCLHRTRFTMNMSGIERKSCETVEFIPPNLEDN